MDGTVLGFFLLATFLGAVVSGLAGFAMGVILLGTWAHFLTPIQTTALIVGYGMLAQGYGTWKLRHALNWRRLAPFLIGGAVGVPIGAMLLTRIDSTDLRPAIGVLLVLYSLYGLARPTFKPLQAGMKADTTVGILNGLLGGLTGLVGITLTIWCQLRGWPKDEQRMVFQPVMFASSAVTAISLGLAGAIPADVVSLYLLGLPLLIAGMWLGFKLYGKLDEAAFRKVILVCLLASGLALAVPTQ